MKKLYKHFGLISWVKYDPSNGLRLFFRGKYTTQVMDYAFFSWVGFVPRKC